MGIGRVALPFAWKLIVPAAKRIGKELIVQAAAELIDIATRKKTPKQALKNTVKNKIKKKLVLDAASPVRAGNGKKQQQQKEKQKFSFQKNELH